MTNKVNVLGVGISVLNLQTALEAVAAAVRDRRKGYICVTGVHGVMEAQDDPEFKRILNGAFLCTPDGMPMVWMGRLSGHADMGRVYGPDLMELLCDRGREMNWRHYFYGGGEGVADALRVALERRFPELCVCGTFTPPFRPLTDAELSDLAADIDRRRPHILWVGLSTPKQERFMAEHMAKLNVPLMIGVGAAFDFHSGRVRQAPRWIQHSGFEWLFRLCQEPRRLWRRYFRNNPLFLGRVVLQLSGLRKYPLE
jgi:N-acetylglucosaminyldiphosphoundecaprenol N-acetyl-beta-D-mannosaminyltransferase